MSLQITQSKGFVPVKIILQLAPIVTEVAFIDPNAVIGIFPMGSPGLCEIALFGKTISILESPSDFYKRLVSQIVAANAAAAVTVINEVV